MELELLHLIGKFEQFKENIFTLTANYENQELLNDYFPDKLLSAGHGRKKMSDLDIFLEDVAWMATDFAQEKQWKMALAKNVANIIADPENVPLFLCLPILQNADIAAYV